MDISIIVAITENNIIGRDNGMPWHLPADLKFFREKTTGHYIVMGRKTFESIGGGRPLPNRVSIIITKQKDYKAEGCLIAHSLEEAIALAKDQDELFIIGGKQIYDQALAFANKMYITRIHTSIDGDTSFPCYDDSKWEMTSYKERDADEKNAYALSFLAFEKKQ
jgi:dihydrofolate reductase